LPREALERGVVDDVHEGGRDRLAAQVRERGSLVRGEQARALEAVADDLVEEEPRGHGRQQHRPRVRRQVRRAARLAEQLDALLDQRGDALLVGQLVGLAGHEADLLLHAVAARRQHPEGGVQVVDHALLDDVGALGGDEALLPVPRGQLDLGDLDVGAVAQQRRRAQRVAPALDVELGKRLSLP
jgi:hypothetical protein